MAGLLDTVRRGYRAMTYGGYGGYGGTSFDFWGSGSSDFHRREYDYRRESGLPWENSVFWIGLRYICTNWQDADPCALRYKPGSPRPDVILQHPYAALMTDPNTDYDGGRLAWGIATSLLCAGRCYLIVERSQLGIPTALYWVPWWQIIPRWNPNGRQWVGWYDYLVNGQTIHLPKDMVVDIQLGMHPLNYRVGLSGTEAVLPQMCTINEGARFMAAATRNPAVFSQLFSPKHEIALTPEQHDKLKAQLQQQGAGENRGGILVPSVPLTVEKLAWSPEELALDSMLKMPEAHIVASMGLNTVALNLTAGERRDVFANKAPARREAYENGIMPLQKLVARQMFRQLPVLFGEAEQAGYSYASVPCLQEQRADMAKRLSTACGGAYMTVNEARKEEGLAPLGEEHNEIRQGPGQNDDDENKDKPPSSGGSDDDE